MMRIDDSSGLTPVPPTERIVVWDVLRGFAVLGIFVANLPFMALSSVITPMQEDVMGFDYNIDTREVFRKIWLNR